MTSNGGSEMTSVLWLFVAAFTLLHPSHATSLPSALQSSWCDFDSLLYIVNCNIVIVMVHPPVPGVLTMVVLSSLRGLGVVSISLLLSRSAHFPKGSKSKFHLGRPSNTTLRILSVRGVPPPPLRIFPRKLFFKKS